MGENAFQDAATKFVFVVSRFRYLHLTADITCWISDLSLI